MKRLEDMNTQELISEMQSQNYDAILYCIKAKLPILNLNAVVFGARYKYKSDDFLRSLVLLESSPHSFFGMPMSSFVLAALDVLDVRHYDGDDEFIKRIIQSQFQFY